MHDNPRTAALRPFSAALVVAGVLALTGLAASDPTLGFVETWPGTSLQGWGGGAALSNPGTGGVSGLGDGYLRFSTPNGLQHNLGVNSFGLEYSGNWIAASVNRVRLWLNDVGVDDPLEMHFSIGNSLNFWQYNIGFLPPNGSWAQFVVDLSSAANWTRIIGTGTFTAALQAVDRVHVRHDRAPFAQTPDPIDADVGLDNLYLTNATIGVPVGEPPLAHPLVLAPPVPNPSRGPVALAVEVYDRGPVRLEIVDAGGRLVRRAELAGAAPGTRIWTWDGLDGAGRITPAGYYRVRAVGDAGGMSRPLVRVQ